MKKTPQSHWEDGSEYKWANRGIIAIGDQCYSIELCATYHGARQYKTLNKWFNLEDAAKEASHYEKLPPTRLWVATLSDYGFRDGDIFCHSKSQMINRAAHAMQIAAKDKKDEFDKLRVEDWMEDGDGSYDMGFRIAKAYDSGSIVLHLSLCHIYYGK
jgi:hypothetical protein